MGNCQAAEAATVVVHHPGGNRVERIYWSVSATEIMNSNPGHYVAQVVETAAVKQLKLLRPDDTLVIGQVYRLISFEGICNVMCVNCILELILFCGEYLFGL